MNGIVTLSVILAVCIGWVKSEAGSKDEQPKPAFNHQNAIGSTPKPDLLSYQQITQQYGNKYQPQHAIYQQQYQPRTQHLQQAVPYNHQPEPVRRPYLAHQHQPTPVAMVIIAQPAYIPASMLQQGNVAQQLLQYFQGGNSQTRYQYIPVNHQPVYQPQFQVPVQTQQIQQFVQYQPQQEATLNKPPPSAVPSVQTQASQSQFESHEALPTPQALVSHQHHVVPHHLSQPSAPEGRSLQYQQFQQQIDYQPQQLQEVEQETDNQNADITRLAQQAAQHFLMNGGLNGGSRTAPAIITGLEHFSPEQQEKIKAQLSTHFGSPLKPLNLQGNQNIQEKENSFPGRSFYQEQRQKGNSEKFVPSIQVKDGEITQTSSG